MRKCAFLLILLLFSTGFCLTVDYSVSDGSVSLEISDILHKETYSFETSYLGTCHKNEEYCSEYEMEMYDCGTEAVTRTFCAIEEVCSFRLESCVEKTADYCRFYFLGVCWWWGEKTSTVCTYSNFCAEEETCNDETVQQAKFCEREVCTEYGTRRVSFSCQKTRQETGERQHYLISFNGEEYSGNSEELTLSSGFGKIEIMDMVSGEKWTAHFTEMQNITSQGRVVFDYPEGEYEFSRRMQIWFNDTLRDFGIEYQENALFINAALISMVAVGLYLNRKYYPMSSLGQESDFNIANVVTGNTETAKETAADIGISLMPVVGVLTDIRDAVKWGMGKEGKLVGMFSIIGIATEFSVAGDYFSDAVKGVMKANKNAKWYKTLDRLPSKTTYNALSMVYNDIATKINLGKLTGLAENALKKAANICDELNAMLEPKQVERITKIMRSMDIDESSALLRIISRNQDKVGLIAKSESLGGDLAGIAMMLENPDRFIDILLEKSGRHLDEFGKIPRIEWVGGRELGASPAGIDTLNHVLALNREGASELGKYPDFILSHEFRHFETSKDIAFSGKLSDLSDEIRSLIKNDVDDFLINKEIIREPIVKEQWLSFTAEEIVDIQDSLMGFDKEFSMLKKNDFKDGTLLLSRVAHFEQFGYKFNLEKLSTEWLAILKELRGLY